MGRGTRNVRIEPSFDRRERGGRDDLRATRDDAPASARSTTSRRAGRSKKRGARRRSIMGRLFYWGLVLGVWALIGLGGVIAYQAAQLPPINQLAVPKRPPNIAILASDGTLIANRGDTGGAAVRLAELPAYLPKAFVAIEDRRFYDHYGVDPMGIGRALVNNLIHRNQNIQGGSTLTQQLAKNLFLTQERTYQRKIQEAILSVWLERTYSKDQIIELYLNRVYFGSGAYGIEAAARRYFDKSASQLTLAESAVLAGLMKAPTRLAPNRNPKAAEERAAQVIAAMREEGYITPAMSAMAATRPARVSGEHGAGSINYAADYVMDALDETIGAIDQDIVVTTTLDRSVQAAAEKALTEELDKDGGKFGVTQGAVVSLDTSGAVKALVGGRNYADSQFNRAVAAKRQPGSAFKPFVYLAALEKGLTPDTMREDAAINLKGWRPENYSRQYLGPVSLTQALAMSLNTVAVRLAVEVGPKAVISTAHRLGIGSELQPNASIALGTSEVTPLELTRAFAPFANGGIGVQPHIITRVRTAAGKQIYQRKGSSLGRLIAPEHVGMMNAMMQETLATGTAKKAQLPGWQAAGKTGTSQDFRDAWFVGYTSALVTGVWLGNDDSSPTKRASGSNLPVAIWSRTMTAALAGIAPTPLPGDWRRQPPPGSLAPAQPGQAPMAGDWNDAPQMAQGFPGGSMPAPPPPVQPLRREASRPTPPGSIPNGSRAAENPWNAPREPGFLEKLFGG